MARHQRSTEEDQDVEADESIGHPIKRFAVALSVISDALVFDAAERGPDEGLRYSFEAIRQSLADRKVAKDVLDGLILKHQAKRLVSSS